MDEAATEASVDCTEQCAGRRGRSQRATTSIARTPEQARATRYKLTYSPNPAAVALLSVTVLLSGTLEDIN